MNIFILDKDPVIAAKSLCDKHISKMVTESAQMLANCFEPNKLTLAPKTINNSVRSHSHFNHPCSKWVRQSYENMEWLIRHALAMEQERLARGYNPHRSVDFIKWAALNIPYEKTGLTAFPIAISPESKCRQSPYFQIGTAVTKYRLYYVHDKNFAVWNYSKTPEWMKWSDKKIYEATKEGQFIYP